MRDQRDGVVIACGIGKVEIGSGTGVVKRGATVNGLVAHLQGGGLHHNVVAHQVTERHHLNVAHQHRVGVGLHAHLFHHRHLRHRRKLVDIFGGVSRVGRVLVLDLSDKQRQESINGRAIAATCRVAGRHVVAFRRGGRLRRLRIQRQGIHQASPSFSRLCCILFTLLSTSTLVSKSREADIMSAICSTTLTSGYQTSPLASASGECGS